MADTAAAPPLPIGYTQDTLQNYYKSLINPIDQDTARQAGGARTDAAARGLEGTATETGGVAAANYYGGLRKDAAASGLAFNMAGLSNQDALIKQQQDWQHNESQLSRDATERLAKMGYDFKADQANTDWRHQYQGAVVGGLASGAGYAAGAFL